MPYIQHSNTTPTTKVSTFIYYCLRVNNCLKWFNLDPFLAYSLQCTELPENIFKEMSSNSGSSLLTLWCLLTIHLTSFYMVWKIQGKWYNLLWNSVFISRWQIRMWLFCYNCQLNFKLWNPVKSFPFMYLICSFIPHGYIFREGYGCFENFNVQMNFLNGPEILHS